MSERKVTKPLTNIEEVLAVLNKISIFGGLNEKQLYEIFKLLMVVNYEEGEFIYKRGEAPSSIYIIIIHAFSFLAKKQTKNGQNLRFFGVYHQCHPIAIGMAF